jgi:hypothetical protein
MYETWETAKRISEAKRLTTRVVDHLQYVLDIHENNAIVLYSDTLSKQVPTSYAANAFNVFREAMHQIEIVRIYALWDNPVIERESILTVVELIDDQKVLGALADQARGKALKDRAVELRRRPRPSHPRALLRERARAARPLPLSAEDLARFYEEVAAEEFA